MAENDDLLTVLKNFKGKDMGELRKKRINEAEALFNNSRKLSELVVREDFRVDSFVCKNQKTSISPRSEVRYGEAVHSYQGGFKVNYELQVTPFDERVPVNTINFQGVLNIQNGDYISVLIPRFEEKTIEELISEHNGKLVYYDRKFTDSELGIEIIRLSDDGYELGRYRSVDYDMFKN